MKKFAIGIAALGLLGIVGAIAQAPAPVAEKEKPVPCFYIPGQYDIGYTKDFLVRINSCTGETWRLHDARPGPGGGEPWWIPMNESQY